MRGPSSSSAIRSAAYDTESVEPLASGIGRFTFQIDVRQEATDERGEHHRRRPFAREEGDHRARAGRDHGDDVELCGARQRLPLERVRSAPVVIAMLLAGPDAPVRSSDRSSARAPDHGVAVSRAPDDGVAVAVAGAPHDRRPADANRGSTACCSSNPSRRTACPRRHRRDPMSPQSAEEQLQLAQITPHESHSAAPLSQFAEQITPQTIGRVEADVVSPQCVPGCHALRPETSRPSATRWLPQNSCRLQLGRPTGYAVVDGAARECASSTAPCALRKPAPWVSAS